MPIVAMLSVRKTAVQNLDGSHHFMEATEQLFQDNSLRLLLTWSRSELMANPHPQLPKPLWSYEALEALGMLFSFVENSLLTSRDSQGWWWEGQENREEHSVKLNKMNSLRTRSSQDEYVELILFA